MPLITSFGAGARGLGWGKEEGGFVVPPTYNTTSLVQHFDAAITASYSGSGTTVTDLSGNNNNGTLVNGVTWTTVGGVPAFTFDGTNDYIASNMTVARQNPHTFDFWLNMSAGYEGYHFGLSGYYSTYYAFSAGASDTNNNIIIGAHGGGGSQLTHSYTVANPGWVNLTFIINYSGSPKKAIYINGSLVASNTLAENYLNNNLTLPYGAYRYAPTSTQTDAASAVIAFYNKSMGVIARYNRALSGSEIASNYNAYKGRFGL